MKNFFLALMIVAMSCSCAFGAASEDVYVRKDLFEVHMQSINAKLDKIDAKLEKIDQDVSDLKYRMTKVETRMDGLEKRFDDLRYDIYLGIGLIGLFGLFIGLPVVQKWWERRQEAKRQTFTLEDIERLITNKIESAMKGNLPNAI